MAIYIYISELGYIRVLRVMVYELLRTALVPGEGLVGSFLECPPAPNNGRL